MSDAANARLRERVTRAVRQAGRAGMPRLVSVTEPAAWLTDPSAVVLASRRPGEPWFCVEQPERAGSVLATLGSVLELNARGAGRFRELDASWRRIAADALSDPPGTASGSGLIVTGGFSFADDGGTAPEWEGFTPGSLTVPELALAQSGGATWLTVAAAVSAGDDPDQVCARLGARVMDLSYQSLPLLDPAPVGRVRVHSKLPPSHYEDAVARGVERIRSGQLEKLVLAREVTVAAPHPHDAAAIFGALRGDFPTCFVYAVGRGDAAFIGATPELLARREGQRFSTVALAGSIRRSSDPAVDEHLAQQLLGDAKNRHENALVVRRIAAALEPYAVWVTAAPEPGIVRVANIQHLAAPIRAQLTDPHGVIEMAGVLHPTPAVGGEPNAIAQKLIPAIEGMDRGWYAGTVGWSDQAGDGEFCVALRCALLRGRHASCFAGCGIVADSDPGTELAETEVKLQALLPLLAA